MESKKFVYQIGPFKSLFTIVLMSGMSWLMLYVTIINDKGLILDGVITLSQLGATILYSLFFCLYASFLLIALTNLYLIFRASKKYLILEKDSFTIPASLFKKEAKVMYKDILRTQSSSYNGVKWVYFISTSQKYGLCNARFQSRSDFKEAISIITERLPQKAKNK